MVIQFEYFLLVKSKMETVMLEILDGAFFGMSSHVPAFKVHVFTSHFKL